MVVVFNILFDMHMKGNHLIDSSFSGTYDEGTSTYTNL